MANLPEDGSTFPAATYQLETTDPVQGGVSGKSNVQAISLGNRTAWLKNRVDSLLTFMTGSRTRLSANTTWYVSTAGSDSNDGSASDSGHAFRTIQKAVDTVLNKVDCNGYQPKIKIADGTYVGAIISGMPPGCPNPIIIEGNTTTPANVVVSATNASAFVCLGSQVQFQGMAVAATGTGTGQGCGLLASNGANILWDKMVFGSCDQAQVFAGNGAASAVGSATYTIAGASPSHLRTTVNGNINVVGATVTLVGGPAFASGFAVAQDPSLIQAYSNTYSGSATGPRYVATLNGVIVVNGGGTSVFPGNSAGATSLGGQYA